MDWLSGRGRVAAALRRASLCLGLLLLSACMGHDIEAIRGTEPSGPAFTQALVAEYRAFALFEADEMYDWIDAGHFARKGLRAAAGEEVEAERLEDWRVPRDHQAELAAARDRLIAAFEADARVKAPQLAAQAQGSFDCWIEQQEENHQPDHIAACRDSFYSYLNELTAILEPKVELEPVPIPVPPATLGIEERVPFTVILFAFDSAALDTQARAAAERAADEAARRPAAMLTVVGHADRRGPEAYNLDLSLRRAEVLRDALVARGVATARIEVIARGEWQAAVPTADGVAEPANRRVEVFVKGVEAPKPAISSISGPSVVIAEPGPKRALGPGETVTTGDTAKPARRLHQTSARGGVSRQNTPLPRPSDDRPAADPQWAGAAHDARACMIWCGLMAAQSHAAARKAPVVAGAHDPGKPPDRGSIDMARAVALAFFHSIQLDAARYKTHHSNGL
jgi:OOP family OmpA-OmpF porin